MCFSTILKSKMAERGNIILTLTVIILLSSGLLMLLDQTFRHQSIYASRQKREAANRKCRNIILRKLHESKELYRLIPADVLAQIAGLPQGLSRISTVKNCQIKTLSEGVSILYDSFELLLVYEKLSVVETDSRNGCRGGILIKGVRGCVPVYLLPVLAGGSVPPAELDRLISFIAGITGCGSLLPFMKTPYISLVISVEINYMEEYCHVLW